MSELSDLRTLVATTCDAVVDQAKGNAKVKSSRLCGSFEKRDVPETYTATQAGRY